VTANFEKKSTGKRTQR